MYDRVSHSFCFSVFLLLEVYQPEYKWGCSDMFIMYSDVCNAVLWYVYMVTPQGGARVQAIKADLPYVS